MLLWQILIGGFAISSLYGLGATGFTLIFGVTGVLNLSHGGIMVAAAVAAWAASGNLGAGAYAAAAFGVVIALLLALATYYLIVRRLQLSRGVREEEKEIFILTATLLWGVMIQQAIAYFYTNSAKTVLPVVERPVDPGSAHAVERDFHRARLLGDDRRALAVRQPLARRQGGARRLDEPTWRHSSRDRTLHGLCRS
jgi:branched-subunit amino acid ABC-type transport system permease component